MAKIIGTPIATPLPKPDWNQTDSTKGDYIKNKPKIISGKAQLELVAGTISSSNGKENPAGNDSNEVPVRMRSDFLAIPETSTISFESDVKYCVFMYKEDKTFIKSNDKWLNSAEE